MIVKKELINLNVQVPIVLRNIIDELIRKGIYLNRSDFVRIALREKLDFDRTKRSNRT